ncbi:hypothetical protein ABT174_26795 [Streptomyces sparsogenes]|uniref:hypothetical protein n=2 Tax=Streptomyces sparsogenes TaxID=67365 RepID=UPI0033213930
MILSRGLREDAGTSMMSRMGMTNIYFEGGARNGTTATWNLEPGADIYDDNIFRPPELYRRTTRTKVIGRVEYTIFRYDPSGTRPT